MQRVLLPIGLLIAAALLNGCATDPPQPNANKRTLIASNAEWAVTAIGPIDRIYDPFFSFPHVEIKFEATRKGRMYATGVLDDDDDPFNSNFPLREWVAPNVLRMGHPRTQIRPVGITVRNEGTHAVAWLAIESNSPVELFLFLGVPMGTEMRLPSKGTVGMVVKGAWEDGRPIKDVWWRSTPEEEATAMLILIREDGVLFNGVHGAPGTVTRN
jgi:hypothetical protein